MTNAIKQKIESKEIDGLTFFKPKFKQDWVISGVDICRFLGYKNPQKQAKKIYTKYKDNFTRNSRILYLPRSKEDLKGGPQSGDPLLDRNYQEIRCYNRPGCWFFVSKCNVDKANKIIERLFNTFDKLYVEVSKQTNIEWESTRATGKAIRRSLTDSIQLFVEWAEHNGSKNAERYYSLYTKALYSAVGHKGPIPKGFRDDLPTGDLGLITFLEALASQAIINSIEKEIYYKEIFTKVRDLLKEKANGLTIKTKLELK